MDDLRARNIALAHDETLCAERVDQWHQHYQPQSLITEHLTTELARASLLADQVAEFRQAELEKQARHEEHQWRRRQRRRVRYLGIKIKTRPAEAVDQLQAFGAGVEFLVDDFTASSRRSAPGAICGRNTTVLGLQLCGCTPEPAAIACNPLAYTILINNMGCSPGSAGGHRPVAGADPAPRRTPRPAPAGAHRCQPGGMPDAGCSRRSKPSASGIRELSAGCDEEVDIPSLCAALNRVCILTDEAARRAGAITPRPV